MSNIIPVVLIIYKRTNNIGNLLNVLSKIKPIILYIIADGPKNESEFKLCEQVRKNVEASITWDCKVIKIYSEKNLGLRKRIVTGVNEVFKKEKWAIILEDDLIPDPSFFRFCEELLIKYENNDKIISISGNNFQFGKNPIETSYYFSSYIQYWGWATWKRAWKLYDDKLSDWNINYNTETLYKLLGSRVLALYWTLIFNMTHENKVDSWAYRWTYTSFKNNLLSITPSVNLVSNIGYGKEATHTKKKAKYLGLAPEKIKFLLRHENNIIRNKKADNITENHVYLTPIIKISLIARYYLKKFFNRTNLWKPNSSNDTIL